MASVARRIGVATALAGTLDIAAATILTLLYGRAPAAMLRYVASGPFPAAKDWGAVGSLLGLGVHYALMATMAAAYVVAADRRPALQSRPVRWGVIYGVLTYVAMNLVSCRCASARGCRLQPLGSRCRCSATSSWWASRSRWWRDVDASETQ